MHFLFSLNQSSKFTHDTDPQGYDQHAYTNTAQNTLKWYPRPQATPRFYLAAVEKNWEKAWDQNYAKIRHGPEMVDSVST